MAEGLEKLEHDFKARSSSLIVLEFSVVFLNIMTAFWGNLFTLIAVLRSPRLRTIPSMFVTWLAVADILQALPSTPLTLSILIKGYWPFNLATCQFQGYYGITMAFAGSEMLALMSLNRYFRIVKPNNYRRIFTRRNSAIMIIFAWLLASLVQLPYVTSGHRYSFHAGKLYCNQDSREPFSTALVSIFGGIPMSIISFCSFKVFRSVQAHRKKRFGGVNNVHANVEDIKVARLLLAMVLAHIVCFTPAIVIETIDFLTQGSYLPRQAYFFYMMMATMSSSVNPLIYGVMNRTFRQEYIRLLCLNRLSKAVAPVATLQTGFRVDQQETMIHGKSGATQGGTRAIEAMTVNATRHR